MNGSGCYGSAIVRVLAGAGYTLRWAGFHVVMEDPGGADDGRRHGGGPLPSSHACGCSHIHAQSASSSSSTAGAGSELKAEVDFVSSFLGYYARAVELRVKGVEDVYAREGFAGRFEREQREVQHGAY